MSRHATVAELVRRTCPDADELLEMLGVTEGGVMQPDPVLEPIVFVQAAPKVGKRAQVEHPHAMDARPKVSTAPEALRNLAPVEVPVKVVKAKPKPKVKLPARPPARRVHAGQGRKLAECGSYGAYRRHLRYGEPIDEPCAEAARRQWRERETPRERYLAPCGTYTALRRHRRLGETCDKCAGAPSTTAEDRARLTERRRQQGIQPRELLPCGTEGAYRRHIRDKTPVCDACRVAHRRRNRELEAAKREAA